jgi:hypothetical protein
MRFEHRQARVSTHDEWRGRRSRSSVFARLLIGSVMLGGLLAVAIPARAGAAGSTFVGFSNGGPSPSQKTVGYAVTADGAVYDFTDGTIAPGMHGQTLAARIVGITSVPGRYWLAASDGGVFSFGAKPVFYGSMGGTRLNSPIVGMAATLDGNGYWLVAGDGGVFSFGSAQFFGSTGAIHLNSPIVGMAPTPDGNGYWLVAADGGVFSFGSAQFFGSMGGTALAAPVVAMAANPDGKGYFLAGQDGGIFTFGDARFTGSAKGRVNAPVIALELVTNIAYTAAGVVAASGMTYF